MVTGCTKELQLSGLAERNIASVLHIPKHQIMVQLDESWSECQVTVSPPEGLVAPEVKAFASESMNSNGIVAAHKKISPKWRKLLDI